MCFCNNAIILLGFGQKAGQLLLNLLDTNREDDLAMTLKFSLVHCCFSDQKQKHAREDSFSTAWKRWRGGGGGRLPGAHGVGGGGMGHRQPPRWEKNWGIIPHHFSQRALTVGHKPPVSHTENEALSAPEADPLENLLIEHPSMSVYQMRRRMSAAEEGELGDQEEGEEEEDASR